ncbi:hypothetical protein [Pelagicoccus mobilis]|uniref:Uncharacterized protein n=1 Tax=Pelagicoccus mobilis TaxID=415221 RepID=A0A934VMQ3_9BACT|nr:hypothetical protein [Pelagicoccus mobilis]MBK1879096.1 hypothetical protein [Pelagicoccus mobilis]
MISKSLVVFWWIVLRALTGAEGSEFGTPEVEFWYGENQSFGHLGNPQRQINLLGSIKAEALETLEAGFFLNEEGEARMLTLGGDLHRLANVGDFNLELDRALLREGVNRVRVFVEGPGGVVAERILEFTYTAGKSWPLPYEIQWENVSSIGDVVEVVDGRWELTEEGLRSMDPYYDRILCFGDESWTNYEVRTSVKFHGYRKPEEGPPTFDVIHVAIATRWPGHDVDELQPNRKWYPLGATSEFRFKEGYRGARWRVFDGAQFYAEQSQEGYRVIEPETWYCMAHRVESLEDGSTLFSVKLWDANEEEPEHWDFRAIKPISGIQSGSTCILAHHTDVTFGDVLVLPVEALGLPGAESR